MKNFKNILVAEIGSTTTVVNAFRISESVQGTDAVPDLESPVEAVFTGQGQAATSVLEGDVRIGLNAAIEDYKKSAGLPDFEYSRLLATSSAAGGLKMTVHGLVYDMTTKAAKEAALGAGANIHMITAGILRKTDLDRIKKIQPNIIMIAGGVDYGERDTAINNAREILQLDLNAPILYAGNTENHDELKMMFEAAGALERLHIVPNVFPKIDMLNVAPARKVIQKIFEDHIIHAPGMEKVREMVDGAIIPTPGAVMEASILLESAIGDLVTIDIGGATTDIHSVTEGSDEISRILISPEPRAKRTVEGDLGLYINLKNIVAAGSPENLANKMNVSADDLQEMLEKQPPIPVTDAQIKLAEELAKIATSAAIKRHAGEYRSLYGGGGKKTFAEGKDLSSVKYIIGTGGALTRLPAREEILKKVFDNPLQDKLLPVESAMILIDNDYIFASLGVLSVEYPGASLQLMIQSVNKYEKKI